MCERAEGKRRGGRKGERKGERGNKGVRQSVRRGRERERVCVCLSKREEMTGVFVHSLSCSGRSVAKTIVGSSYFFNPSVDFS